MSNEYYNNSSWPVTGSGGASAPARSETTAIAAGFALLPALAGNAGKAAVVNPGSTALTVTTGTLALAGNLATTGAFNTTLVQGASVSLTLPLVNATLATLAKRVVALVDAATVTLVAGTTDTGLLTSLSQTTTFANPSGSPTDGQVIEFRIKSTNSQAVSFGAQFRGCTDISLPTATAGASLTQRWYFEWNTADSKWDIVGMVIGH